MDLQAHRFDVQLCPALTRAPHQMVVFEHVAKRTSAHQTIRVCQTQRMEFLILPLSIKAQSLKNAGPKLVSGLPPQLHWLVVWNIFYFPIYWE
jgi:hypothetical protein